MKKTEFIWMNGSVIPWEKATLHVLSHVVHYGTSWFEGIRCYNTKRGTAVFKLIPHLLRFHASAKVYRTEIPYTVDQLTEAVKEIIKVNKLEGCYIRPFAYRGFGELGVNPLTCPVETVIAVWEWGSYLGQDSLEKGIDVMTSSWRRFAGSTLPANSKAGGNYMNSQLIKMEAMANGYTEGLALDSNGHVCEGSGENFFLVKDGVLYTPPLSSGILPGITRAVVMQFATEEGIKVVETSIPRDYIYTADELFFTGTAAEITPIRTVDKISIADKKPGPVTRMTQNKFFDVTREGNDPNNWLTWLD